MRTARKDWVFLGVFWVLFVVIGEAMVLKLHLLPAGYSHEAEVGDEAYKLLIGLAVPIFAGVSASLLTILVRQVDRRQYTDGTVASDEDGEYVRTNKRLVPIWIGLSAILAIGLAINPGFTGLRDIRGESRADIVIAAQGQRWSWQFTYPGGEVSTTELVLPIDQRVRFDLTSIDVIHSFWVPGFRIKLDNVPGRTTQLYISPDKLGDGNVDSTLRVQCAELCGAGHAAMAVPIRIVTEAEFEDWLASLREDS